MALAVGGIVDAPPYAPIPISPANGEATDLAGTPEFVWQYQFGTPGAVQTGWAFRRKVAGASTYQWWNKTTSAWQTTPFWNTGATANYTFPAAAWSDTKTWNWSVATKDANGSGSYCSTVTVIGRVGPKVTVAAPAGTTATDRPAVQWTPTVATGCSQIAYRVCIYDAAQYSASGFAPGVGTAVYDSGIVYGSATLLRPPSAIALTNHTTFRAYVWVQETGGQTVWGYAAFTARFTAPATPTVAVTSTETETTGKPVNVVTVTGHDVAPLNGHTFATVRYSDDSGKSWWSVRGGTGVAIMAGIPYQVIDKTAPLGYQRQYRVTVYANNPTVVTTPIVATLTTITSLYWWLSDPLTGTAVKLHGGTKKMKATSTDRQRKYAIMGRPDPVVLRDSFGLPNLTLTLVFLTDATYRKFESLRATGHVLLLQGPHPAGQWYVSLGELKTDTTTLPSLRGWGTTGVVVRNVQITAQAVAAP